MQEAFAGVPQTMRSFSRSIVFQSDVYYNRRTLQHFSHLSLSKHNGRRSSLPQRVFTFLSLVFFALLITIAGNGCTQNSSSKDSSGAITGTVHLGPHVPLWMMHGTLTVVVYMKGSTSPAYLPVALEEFYHPAFPVPFRITQKNVRLSGIDLKGNVRLVANLTIDSGSPLVASGTYTGATAGEVAVGGPPVNLLVDTPAPR